MEQKQHPFYESYKTFVALIFTVAQDCTGGLVLELELVQHHEEWTRVAFGEGLG